MVITNFEKHKVELHIKRYGTEFIFNRNAKNEYGEEATAKSVVCTLKGIYHEQSSYINIQTTDNSQTQQKKQQMIICLFEDCTEVKMNDVVVLNSKELKVTDVVNLNEMNIIANICLEEIQTNG